ncbi:hypothetical protein ITI46_00915 [Streptomyces oryzae]|uniref:ABC transporter permease n=1 Tax=Streptomyces oryzae TaxID=1434886 RepID=A0ABS3X4I3_9ACTN|nr:hypothetical protein [Streptomyces oryzae]MBO8190287.1 hypothetical protein [Streptomyces oryzae]
MFHSALRDLHAHKRRFQLPAVAVVLGVAFTSGSLLYTQSVRTALEQAQATAQPDVSVAVRPDTSADDAARGARARLDDRLLNRLRTLPGAAAVRGTAEGTAFVVGPGGELIGPRGAPGSASAAG